MRTISLDPGESTGWATWDDGKLVDSGTDPLWKVLDAITVAAGLALPGNLIPPQHLCDAFADWDELVVEDWALYPWKLDRMQWDSCRTARGIGVLEMVARATGKPITLQPAAIKDEAEAAGAETLFDSPLHENRHANDAKRHGVFYFARQSPDYQPAPAGGEDGVG